MKPRPIKSMEALLPDQLAQVAEWLQSGETLQKISARIQEEFGHHVSVTSLHRFHQRLTIQDAEETRPELADAALSWLKFAATGEVDFSAATLELIKQQIFQLVATQGDPDRLKFLFNILFTTQRQTTRQRHAAVAEIRAQAATDRNLLAERNLALKFELAGIRYNYALNKESAVKPTPNIIPEWGPILRALEEQNRRRTQPVPETNKAPAPAPSPAPEPVNPAPAPAPVQQPTQEPEPQAAVVQPEEEEEPLPGEKIGSDFRGHPEPDAPTLGDRIRAYVDVRRKEFERHQRYRPDEYFQTVYRCCPCGNRILPCPHHGMVPYYFWTCTPGSQRFKEGMNHLFPNRDYEHLYQEDPAP